MLDYLPGLGEGGGDVSVRGYPHFPSAICYGILFIK